MTDIDQTRRDLIAMRERHGSDSAIGHRCSNLVELLQAHAKVKAMEAECEPLEQEILKQMAELAALNAEE